MATYSTIKTGSKGSSVTELQKLLNKNGYNLAEDGVFGSKTAAAVKDYQNKNNLSVDGIVGSKTWGALTGTNNAAKATTAANTGLKNAASTIKTPTGATVNAGLASALETPAQKAAKALAEWEAQKPKDYKSTYQEQITEALNGILNREKFSYDFMTDPTYQQYAQKYQQLGRLAMEDTVADVAALSGGMANSYAQTAGQQAYNAQLQNMNDIIPALQEAAYNRYAQEGADMRNNLTALQNMEDTEYGRYRDTVGDWNSQLNYLANKLATEQDQENWLKNFNQAVIEAERDQENWEKSFAQDQENWQKEFDLALQKYNDALAAQNGTVSSAGSSSGGGSKGGSGGGKGGNGGNKDDNTNDDKQTADNNTTELSEKEKGALNTVYSQVLKNASESLRTRIIQQAVDEGKINQAQAKYLADRYA